MTTQELKKGNTLRLNITDYAFEGKGISKVSLQAEQETLGNFVVFVKGAYPGDVVDAKIIKKKKNFAEAFTEKVIEKSEDRAEARCRYFGVCGGCKQQDLNYLTQLKYKQNQVVETLKHIGGQSDFVVEPITACDKIFNYRNKMEFSFSDKRWLTPEELNSENGIENRNFALGLHIPRIFDKVLDIEECHLHPETGNEILNFTRKFFRSRNSTVYSTKTHQGFLRNLVIKYSRHHESLMVNLVTSQENDKLMTEYTENLIKTIPQVTTVINNINLRKAQVAKGDYEKVYYGDGFIFDSIGDFKFRISANSFFQTNTLQAQKLYNAVVDFGEFKREDIVYDLYCGAGTISIYISAFVKSVFGLEYVEEAIDDARLNTELNSVGNCKFFAANLNKSFLYLIEENSLPKPDIVVADPPRSGMNPKTVKDIISLSTEKIVYVSCNPSTQARDIKTLCEEGGYKLIKVRPVDMFPHTYHIENVVLLIK